MAHWTPLRQALEQVETSITLTWSEHDTLVGGLPPSAYAYSAFWKGDRSAWRGFAAADVRVGDHVTFVRRIAAPSGRDYGSARLDLRRLGWSDAFAEQEAVEEHFVGAHPRHAPRWSVPVLDIPAKPWLRIGPRL